MVEITIIDYGVGNLKSVEHAFVCQGYKTCVTSEKRLIEKAHGLILPGVGAFGRAIVNLHELDLIHLLRQKISLGTPFLGICLGLQLLFENSEETGEAEGLSLFKGKVVRFQGNLKIPLIGWNQLQLLNKEEPLFKGIKDNTFFYFVHSYYAQVKNHADIVAVSYYGSEFPAVVRRGNCYGVQFHPEKSSCEGLKIINNFGKLVREKCK